MTTEIKLHNKDQEHLVQLMEALYLMDAFEEHGMDCTELESYKEMKNGLEVYLCERGILSDELDEEGVRLYTFEGDTGDAIFDEYLTHANPWSGDGLEEEVE